MAEVETHAAKCQNVQSALQEVEAVSEDRICDSIHRNWKVLIIQQYAEIFRLKFSHW